jgi:Spy/CpxP family protein refolding chaperone
MMRHSFLALTLAAAGLLAAVRPVAAQTGGAPQAPSAADSSRKMMDPIARLLERRDELKLTDDQARQLEAIRTKYQEKHKDRLEQMRRDREARSAFRASLDSARAEVAAVLTPEQEKQVEAMREEWRREWREAHRGRHGHKKHHDHGEDG